MLWPDPDEAHELIARELENSRYDPTTVTWWDKLVSSIVNFFVDLFTPDAANAVNATVTWVIALTVVALLVLAFILITRPRRARSSRATPDTLFGEDESRSAAELRAAANERARAGDFSQAIVLRVRALARGLHERGITVLAPGATVQQFAAQAAFSFDERGADFAHAARIFDGVRYVRATGSPHDYEFIARLDDDIERTRPARVGELPAGVMS